MERFRNGTNPGTRKGRQNAEERGRLAGRALREPERRLARLRALQAGSDVRLSLIAQVPGGRELELQLHTEFADDRLSGEWFRSSRGLKAKIKELESAG